MREKNIIIICVTLILCVCLVCGTLLLTHNGNQDNNTNNTTNNTTTVNSTINNTNNTTTTITKTSNSKPSSKKSSSSSSNNYIQGNKIESSWDVDEDTQRINTKNDIYYKNKKTGQTRKRHLDSDGMFRYYPI